MPSACILHRRSSYGFLLTRVRDLVSWLDVLTFSHVWEDCELCSRLLKAFLVFQVYFFQARNIHERKICWFVPERADCVSSLLGLQVDVMVDSRLRALNEIGDVNFVQSEDIWFNAPRKGVLVFALPGERCVADITGDFKIQFSDRHGDFYWYSHPPSCLKVAILYNEEKFQLRLWHCSCRLWLTCEYRLFPSGWEILQNWFNCSSTYSWSWCLSCSWLNTNMMETRQILETSDLDGFEKVIFLLNRWICYVSM